MENNFKVWYLFHSGFAVKKNNKVFIFDYYNNRPKNDIWSFNSGVVNPQEICNNEVYVFVSHSHFDHYNNIIFTWQNDVKHIKYIVSSDVLGPTSENIFYVTPSQNIQVDDLSIKTLASTDEGVAFYISCEEINIFHSGDLNWWNWSGETDEYNKNMEKHYKEEINKLNDLPIDIAFIPVDPRLNNSYALSLNYFINNIASSNCHIYPMHFSLDIRIWGWLERDSYLTDTRIQMIRHRGLITDLE